VNSKLENEHTTELFEAVLSLKSVDECYNFFEDLFTISELTAIVQRFQVAKMLYNNKQYSEIVSETGASTATISRVKKCLNYGADGYKMILGRLGNK